MRLPNLTSRKAPGHDLLQNGRFGSSPQEKFNSRARANQNAKFDLKGFWGYRILGLKDF